MNCGTEEDRVATSNIRGGRMVQQQTNREAAASCIVGELRKEGAEKMSPEKEWKDLQKRVASEHRQTLLSNWGIPIC